MPGPAPASLPSEVSPAGVAPAGVALADRVLARPGVGTRESGYCMPSVKGTSKPVLSATMGDRESADA